MLTSEMPKYMQDSICGHRTIKPRMAGKIVRMYGNGKLPKVGWKQRLANGVDLCHGSRGYYIAGTVSQMNLLEAL